jgi:predicted nucleic acid-binding protein
LIIVADTNVLIELYLPTTNADSVQHWWAVDKYLRLPSLWICEFRHIHLKYLRAGLMVLIKALENLEVAERLFLSQTSRTAMLLITRLTSAEVYTPWLTPDPISWISCAARTPG